MPVTPAEDHPPVLGDTGDAGAPRRRRVKSMALVAVSASLAAFLLMQLVPYGWTKSNPPVTSPAPWPSTEAEAIARTSCYDCHSNETEWPAYSYVAPMSWVVRRDVEAGRREMNFSEWDEESADAAEDAEGEIIEGRMPLPNYRRIHRDAQLSDEDAAILVDALEQMSDDDGGRSGGDDHES
jgi:hypothetical protein